MLGSVEGIGLGAKVGRRGLALAVVKDLREFRAEPSKQDLEDFETDTLAGFVLARASAGLADGTIRGDVGHLEPSAPASSSATPPAASPSGNAPPGSSHP